MRSASANRSIDVFPSSTSPSRPCLSARNIAPTIRTVHGGGGALKSGRSIDGAGGESQFTRVNPTPSSII